MVLMINHTIGNHLEYPFPSYIIGLHSNQVVVNFGGLQSNMKTYPTDTKLRNDYNVLLFVKTLG